jgi:hypothetical protein
VRRERESIQNDLDTIQTKKKKKKKKRTHTEIYTIVDTKKKTPSTKKKRSNLGSLTNTHELLFEPHIRVHNSIGHTRKKILSDR